MLSTIALYTSAAVLPDAIQVEIMSSMLTPFCGMPQIDDDQINQMEAPMKTMHPDLFNLLKAGVNASKDANDCNNRIKNIINDYKHISNELLTSLAFMTSTEVQGTLGIMSQIPELNNGLNIPNMDELAKSGTPDKVAEAMGQFMVSWTNFIREVLKNSKTVDSPLEHAARTVVALNVDRTINGELIPKFFDAMHSGFEKSDIPKEKVSALLALKDQNASEYDQAITTMAEGIKDATKMIFGMVFPNLKDFDVDTMKDKLTSFFDKNKDLMLMDAFIAFFKSIIDDETSFDFSINADVGHVKNMSNLMKTVVCTGVPSLLAQFGNDAAAQVYYTNNANVFTNTYKLTGVTDETSCLTAVEKSIVDRATVLMANYKTVEAQNPAHSVFISRRRLANDDEQKDHDAVVEKKTYLKDQSSNVIKASSPSKSDSISSSALFALTAAVAVTAMRF